MQLLLFNFPDSRIPNLGLISDAFGISITLWFSQSLDFSSPGIFVVDIQGKCQRHIQIHYIAWGNGQQTHTHTHARAHTHARDSFGVLDALFPLEYRKAEERRQAKNDSDSTHGDL